MLPQGEIWPPLVRDDKLQYALRELVECYIDGGATADLDEAVSNLEELARKRAEVAIDHGYVKT